MTTKTRKPIKRQPAAVPKQRVVRPMKCWIGNLDGRRQGLIVATSQRAAAKAVGTGLTDFLSYWVLQTVCPKRDPKPLTLYTRPYGSLAYEEFSEGRCSV